MHDFYTHHGQNNATSPVSHASSHMHPIHNPSSSYYHHPHHHSGAGTGASSNNGYSSPQTNATSPINGNESPNSVDQYPANSIQLPETPNSLTIMGPTSGNSGDEGNTISEQNPSENAVIVSNNNNYNPWSTSFPTPPTRSMESSGHHSISNGSPPYPGSYPQHHSASMYSAHHNLSSSLIQHQNMTGFSHHHASKGFGMPQPFYTPWY